RARESPSLSFPSKTRGVARREGALSGFRRTARLLGRTRIAGPLAHMTRAPASLDAPRGITAFAFTASRTEPAVFVPRGGFPSAARGGGLRGAARAGAAPRPTFTTPRDDAPRWTGRM